IPDLLDLDQGRVNRNVRALPQGRPTATRIGAVNRARLVEARIGIEDLAAVLLRGDANRSDARQFHRAARLAVHLEQFDLVVRVLLPSHDEATLRNRDAIEYRVVALGDDGAPVIAFRLLEVDGDDAAIRR